MDGDLLIGNLPVHPLADLFPMLPEDELADLAADIKANGLIHPLMLDQAGKMLVDGRNRLRACEIAGVEPDFETLPEGIKPAEYIASVNLRRRNLTRAQQAIALAMIYPEPKRGRGHKDPALEKVPETGGFGRERLRQAREVFRLSRDEFAPLVLSGAMSLDEAFATVRHRQQAAQSEDDRLARLARTRPDLADKVREGELTLDGQPLIAQFVEMKTTGERQAQGGDQKTKSRRAILKIGDLGITATQASRWQGLARLAVLPPLGLR